MKPFIVGALILALLVGGSWYLLQPEPTPEAEPVDLTVADAPQAPTVVWESTIVREDEFAAPISEVHAIVEGTRYDLGTSTGSCAEMTTDLLVNEAGAYVCWFAGAGTEFALFERGGVITLEKGVIEEGSAEYEGYRGDFTVIHTIAN